MIRSVLRALVATAFASAASAQSSLPRRGDPVGDVDYPMSTQLVAVTANAFANVECRPAGNEAEIECVFSEIRFRANEFQPMSAESRAQFSRLTTADVARARRDPRFRRDRLDAIRTEAGHVCRFSPDPSWPVERRAFYARLDSSRAGAQRRALACELASSCEDVSCIQRWGESLVSVLSAPPESTSAPSPEMTCEVTSTTWSIRLRAAGRARWSSLIPSELCDVETAVTLERVFAPGEEYEDEGPHDWRYSQIRRRTGPTQGSDPGCSALQVDVPYAMTSGVSPIVSANCTTLSFMPLAHGPFSSDARMPIYPALPEDDEVDERLRGGARPRPQRREAR